MKYLFYKILTVTVIVALVAGGVWLDFHIWRLQHPAAPAWTFWVK